MGMLARRKGIEVIEHGHASKTGEAKFRVVKRVQFRVDEGLREGIPAFVQ